MSDFVKVPCKHCPFRKDVKPFLHPERAEEFVYAAHNPFNTFTCHKTLDHDEDGNHVVSQESKECAGFLTMKAVFGIPPPDGFTPAFTECYEDELDMITAYTEQWNHLRP
jgi:hypothetical protein